MLKKPRFLSWQGFRSQLPLLVLPVLFVISALWARAQGGPAWLWFNLDPDYFYLLDALNILNLTTPGHVMHPGTTVQWLSALILKLAHPATPSGALTGMVLAEPEPNLQLIAVTFTGFTAMALWGLGAAGRRVFGGWTAAGFLQLAPFMSMVVFKHAYRVKPEALLVLTMLVLAWAVVTSLTPGVLARRRVLFGILFGAIAGFGVATKITAFPVFLLPVFVLGAGAGMRVWSGSVLVYGLAAFAALVLFTLPAIGAYQIFLDWMVTISQGSGAYGGGASGDFMNWAGYPKQVLKLFKRPAFHVVFLISVVVLALTLRRRVRDGDPLTSDTEGLALVLAGIVVSQLAHVLLVAKQANAMYMIPSFVLIPLAFVLAWRLGERLLPRSLATGAVVLLAALVIAQGAGVARLGKELADDRRAARSVDMDRFKSCARVYSYAASSPSYALMLADYVTGERFAGWFSANRPGNDYWLEHWWDQNRLVFRDWRGPEDMRETLARYPCVAVRASHWYILERLLPETMPELIFDKMCRAGKETIAVRGADCSGQVIQP
ncbi:MAG: hypothetical protein H8E39_14595 [Alphaproteobacteria bacterium]|nr:hypothetical protein [Alphaproteobacteria bacterium]